jgi:hypothetical protein
MFHLYACTRPFRCVLGMQILLYFISVPLCHMHHNHEWLREYYLTLNSAPFISRVRFIVFNATSKQYFSYIVIRSENTSCIFCFSAMQAALRSILVTADVMIMLFALYCYNYLTWNLYWYNYLTWNLYWYNYLTWNLSSCIFCFSAKQAALRSR